MPKIRISPLGTAVITAIIANSVLFYYHDEVKSFVDNVFPAKQNVVVLQPEIKQEPDQRPEITPVDDLDKGIQWAFFDSLPDEYRRDHIYTFLINEGFEKRLNFQEQQENNVNRISSTEESKVNGLSIDSMVYAIAQRSQEFSEELQRHNLKSSRLDELTSRLTAIHHNEHCVNMRLIESYNAISEILTASPSFAAENNSLNQLLSQRSAKHEDILSAYHSLLREFNVPIDIIAGTYMNNDRTKIPHCWLRVETEQGLVDFDPIIYRRSFVPVYRIDK